MIRAHATTPPRPRRIRRHRARRRIARDVFGKPLSITRSGTWNGSPISESRRYVYDTHQRLCKRVEPE
ncbi:MAG: hypothetical protein JSS44_13345, partial [Proteobacteria bacterium]|nr:hypothetical protein [Pseudomonadota bacterium]MBS0498839.1 hypothetical protein [Pseudomonadota bacterium]